MSKSLTKTLMVMAGGTGGHVYPAMAVADHLQAEGWHIVWLCTQGGMENRLIEGKGYSKAMIHMQGVRGKGLLTKLLLPANLLAAFWQAAPMSHSGVTFWLPLKMPGSDFPLPVPTDHPRHICGRITSGRNGPSAC